jgi:hypothetical protein
MKVYVVCTKYKAWVSNKNQLTSFSPGYKSLKQKYSKLPVNQSLTPTLALH